MAYDINEVQILGRLGQDPDVKSFQNGGQIANLRVATSESWKDRQTGEKQERTEWHQVTLRGDGLIKLARDHLRKGSRVLIRGKLQTRKWQDQSGNDRYSTEIVVAGYEGKVFMLDGKPAGQSADRGRSDDWGGRSGAGASSEQRMGGGHTSGAGTGGFGDDLDDDIPF